MKKIISIGLLVYLFICLFPPLAGAQTIQPKEVYIQGQVTKIVNEVTTIGDGGSETLTQTVQIKLSNNKLVTFDQSTDAKVASLKKFSVGQQVIVDQTFTPDGATHYVITDTYRIPSLILLS